MILLNITFSLDNNIAKDFTGFVRDILVPTAERGGLNDILFSKVRAPGQENFITRQLSSSYALQMKASSEDELNRFMNGPLQIFNKRIAKKWGPSVACFETILDIIPFVNEQ